MQGHPLARSVYESLLKSPGIHRQVDGIWAFHPPTPDHPTKLDKLWKVLKATLGDSEIKRTCVEDLYKVMQAVPYGMKEGPLPILLCAYLLANESQVAVYEDGAFVPSMTLSHYERLMRNPGKFHLQQYRVDGIRSAVFAGVLDAYSGIPDNHAVLSVVRPIMRLVGSLPQYSKVTKTVSATCIEVRRALMEATDPVALLFKELPTACDFPPLDSQASEHGLAMEFITKLKGCLRELQTAYPDLLRGLENQILGHLGVESKGETGRQNLTQKAKQLLSIPVEDQSKAILVRLSDDRLDLQPWVESVATALASKPPNVWVDKDHGVFETNLRKFARTFRQLETLRHEINGSANEAQAYCLSIISPKSEQKDRAICPSKQLDSETEGFAQKLVKFLAELGLKHRPDAALLTLTKGALQVIQDYENTLTPTDGEQLELPI